jgi:hypothetical protein
MAPAAVHFSDQFLWHRVRSSRYDFTIALDDFAEILLKVPEPAFAPYQLIYFVRDKSPDSKRVADLFQLKQVTALQPAYLHLASPVLTDLPSLENDPYLESSLSLNGTIGIQFLVFEPYGDCEESSIYVNTAVKSALTGEIREYPEYGKLFRSLKAAIKKKARSRLK